MSSGPRPADSSSAVPPSSRSRIQIQPSLHSSAPPTPDADYVASAPASASRRRDAKEDVRSYAGREGMTCRSIRNRHTLTHDSRIPCCSATYAECACVPRRRAMSATCTHGSPCLPTIPPAAALSPSLAARLPRSRAGALHAPHHAHFSAYPLRMHAHTYAHDAVFARWRSAPAYARSASPPLAHPLA
ncbi:hypothetical protein B0H17DRAFT_1193584 [Mycena rosella]|uniref:Uncharacterized protein n=1 Tax=Mycena rosella TaxID=1033263 RepID=A0AAD7GSG9_MYCRO|nr:hypothetical protein B0H17DRAFT_1193584 [Mycena rosella]